ncbi:hypothetical protein [Pseudomonas putida]|uniref:hypothetical protein n=1 Tax=Pseudomonas putida TaxID=303 RepID=UPI001E509698|nr:hypothetical protein [Pseudomonas putida]MCE0958477.1 hypothetical protein [Pseudomonas putida]
MTNASVSNATSAPARSARSARISVGAGLVMFFENTLANQNHVSLHLAYSAYIGLDEDDEFLAPFRLER